MFQQLKAQIAAENVQKIRLMQRQISRGSQFELDRDNEDSFSEEGDLAERMEMFKILMEEKEQNGTAKVTQYQMNSAKWSQMVKRQQLLEEKIKMEREQHERQLLFAKQRWEREMNVIKAELEKYQFKEKKQLKEDGLILTLKKQNRQFLEMYSQSSEAVQKFSMENSSLKKEIARLRGIIKQKEENEACLEAQKHLETESEKNLKQEIARLTSERDVECERRKQLQNSVSKLKLQNDELIREIDRSKMENAYERQKLIQQFKQEKSRLQEDNLELKKRNKKLEQSFIEHLTQTSFNLQQNLKNGCDKTKNTSLYLQESPIRSRSKGKERQRSSSEEEDPEKSNCIDDKCGCSGQLFRLKGKLKQANAKIVQLLQQKCHAYRQI